MLGNKVASLVTTPGRDAAVCIQFLYRELFKDRLT